MATLIKRVGEKPFTHKDPKKQQKVFKTHASIQLNDDEVIEWKQKRSGLHVRKVALTNDQKKARAKSKAAKQARKRNR